MAASLLAGCALDGPARFSAPPAGLVSSRQPPPAPVEERARPPQAEPVRNRVPVPAVEVAREPAKEAPPPAAPIDPGARRLLERIGAGLDWLALETRPPVLVGVRRVRNQSHAAPEEFERLCGRLADALSRAGSEGEIVFTTDPEIFVDVELTGTAYLVTQAGFDQWELYLRLRPARQMWRQWQLAEPVRVLRQPRPGLPEIYVEPGSR